MQLSQSLLDKILRLANEAGKHLARFYQQDVKIQTKSDNTPVTEADLFVSQFLIEKLTALFPDIPVLSEENCNIPFKQRQTWQTYWLIDPLDGTTAIYRSHRSIFGVNYTRAKPPTCTGCDSLPYFEYHLLRNERFWGIQTK